MASMTSPQQSFPIPQDSASSQSVCNEVALEALPIWARQIETARQQTEDAIISLTARFDGIAQRLDTALGTTERSGGPHAISADAEQAEQDLGYVMDALKAIQRSRDALANDIRGLVAHTRALQEMSSEVESIAFKTNILALNAAIEAAHSGAAGKGFAVVAQEVRSLSSAARDTGKRISDTVNIINRSLIDVGSTNESVSARDQKSVEESEVHIRTVLERFRERTGLLAETAERSRSESSLIKQEVCESLVQLQFQDRTSQILSQVINAMNSLPRNRDTTDAAAPRQSVQAHLDIMARGYTTEEQRVNHTGGPTPVAAPADVTFF